MARRTCIQLRETILRLWMQAKGSRTIASIVGVRKSTVNDFPTKYCSGYGLKNNIKAVIHGKPLFGWTKSSKGSLQWILGKQHVISLAN